MLAGITHETLFDVLFSLPPMEIKAVALRHRFAEGEVLERRELDEATKQLITYTESCARAIQQIRHLTAVPAREESLIAGYPL